MNYQAVLYPYHLQAAPLLRHPGLMKDITIRAVVSPEGWGFAGKDASAADGGGSLNLTVHGCFADVTEPFDSVFFYESPLPIDLEKDIVPRMITMAGERKHVLSTIRLPEALEAQVKESCLHSGVDYRTFIPPATPLIPFKETSHSLLKIDTPIIFILGLSERCNKFEAQLSLREAFLEAGYSISQIGSRSYCECMGFHSLPDFMLEARYTETEKIILFNRYVKELERTEKPDLILIGIPGGIAMLNEKVTNHFGILAYEIAQAVRPDAAVVSTFYNAFTPEYFERIQNLLRYRAGFEVDHFIIANTRFEWDVANMTHREAFLTLSSDFIDSKIGGFQEMGVSVFNIHNREHVLALREQLIENLNEYADIEVM